MGGPQQSQTSLLADKSYDEVYLSFEQTSAIPN